MTLKLLLILFVTGFLFSCNKADIERICEPQLTREFNTVYNAHFKGTLHFTNLCSDTALVLRLEVPTDTVPPGSSRNYSLSGGEQYLVSVACDDSTHTYTYSNSCP